MSVTNRFIFVLLILSSTFLYFGCSSSSSSTRYNDHSDNSDTDKSSTRYSPNNKNYDGNLTTEDSGDLPDNDGADITEMMNLYNSSEDNNTLINTNRSDREKMLMEILKFVNTPYQYGGNTKSGIDCSAFTQTVFKNSLLLKLNRSAREQYKQGEGISSIEELKFGDLVFFDTQTNAKPGHVGIYIGDNLFAHASSKKGVTISSLGHTYYLNRFMGGRRIEPAATF